MKELLVDIVKSIVDKPDEVSIEVNDESESEWKTCKYCREDENRRSIFLIYIHHHDSILWGTEILK